MQEKSVLISIQPQWCELIFRGKKTVEVRKSRPKLETPFKCYIYCTKEKNVNEILWTCGVIGKFSDKANGRIIGEFICDTFVTDRTFGHDPLFNGAACMSEIDASIYSCQSSIYGWHISDLKIYDRPKELSEFKGLRKTKFGYEPIKIKRPPQSWCYVEECEDNA